MRIMCKIGDEENCEMEYIYIYIFAEILHDTLKNHLVEIGIIV